MSVQYKIYCRNYINGVPFDYPILDREKDLFVKNPKLIKETNSLEQLTFTIYSDNPNYSQLLLKESIIKVYQNNTIIFKGKIIKEKFNFDKSKQITCEGLLASLVDNYWNDINYTPKDNDGGPFGDYFFPYDNGVGTTWEGWFNRTIIDYNNDFTQREEEKINIGETCPNTPKLFNNTYPTYNGYGSGAMATDERTKVSKGKRLIDNLQTMMADVSPDYEGSETDISQIQSYMIKYFVPSYTEDKTFLNLYTDKDLETKMNGQEIVFGENLIDLFVEADTTDIITAIIPTGEIIDFQNQRTPVDIRYFNSPYKYEKNEDIYLHGVYMYSKSGVEKYGWIVDNPTNTKFTIGSSYVAEGEESAWLENEGSNYLKRKANYLKETVTINAADLSFASGYDESAFEFLKYVWVKDPQHLTENKTYLITKMEYNLLEPEKNKITFNQTSNTISSSAVSMPPSGAGISGSIANQSNNNKNDYSKIENEITNIKKDYATTEYVSSVQTDLSSYIDQQAGEILTSVKEDTSIVKTVTYYQVVSSTEEGALEVVADDIEPTETQIKIGDLASCDCDVAVGDYVVLVSASQDYEALKQTLQSLVSQTSSALELNFLTETVVNAINEAADGVDSKYSFVNNYFRFDSDGALTIGQVDNPFILKLQNDRISFIEDGVEIAYISNNKLYITDGEFLNSLDIGGFSFVPRSNGNLSFR